LMLMVHSLMTPFVASHHCENMYWAGLLCFLVTGSFWSLVYIAREIDSPFGDDANDFDLADKQQVFNNSMLVFLQPQAQRVPSFSMRGLNLVRSDTHIEGRVEAIKSGRLKSVRDLLLRKAMKVDLAMRNSHSPEPHCRADSSEPHDSCEDFTKDLGGEKIVVLFNDSRTASKESSTGKARPQNQKMASATSHAFFSSELSQADDQDQVEETRLEVPQSQHVNGARSLAKHSSPEMARVQPHSIDGLASMAYNPDPGPDCASSCSRGSVPHEGDIDYGSQWRETSRREHESDGDDIPTCVPIGRAVPELALGGATSTLRASSRLRGYRTRGAPVTEPPPSI